MLCLQIFFVLFIEQPIYHCTLPLKKAFDTADHQILIQKFVVYGVDGKELSWLNPTCIIASSVAKLMDTFTA